MAKATPPKQLEPKIPDNNDTSKQKKDDQILSEPQGDGEEGEEEDPDPDPGGVRPVKPPPHP